MDIYIKPNKKATITGKNIAIIKDVADIIAPNELEAKIYRLQILKKGKEKNYLISITDLIKEILIHYPEAKVINLGEVDTWVEFESGKKESIFKNFIFVFFISITLAFGSSTAVMSFHTDAQMAKVFQNYHEIFFGEFKEKPYIIEIPYSIGLSLGIIVFFNHFGGKKLTDDPTPIEVEMTSYKRDVEDAVINDLTKKKDDKED